MKDRIVYILKLVLVSMGIGAVTAKIVLMLIN